MRLSAKLHLSAGLYVGLDAAYLCTKLLSFTYASPRCTPTWPVPSAELLLSATVGLRLSARLYVVYLYTMELQSGPHWRHQWRRQRAARPQRLGVVASSLVHGGGDGGGLRAGSSSARSSSPSAAVQDEGDGDDRHVC
jgi:hypothetical protein